MLRPHIPMEDIVQVRVGQGAGHVVNDRLRASKRQASALLDKLRQRHAAQRFHDHDQGAAILIDIVDPLDVGMRERLDVADTLQQSRITARGCVEYLDGHAMTDIRHIDLELVNRLEQHIRWTFAQDVHDLIATVKHIADAQRHRWPWGQGSECLYSCRRSWVPRRSARMHCRRLACAGGTRRCRSPCSVSAIASSTTRRRPG